MKKNIISKIILLCSTLVLSTSCSDYLTYDENRAYSDEMVWSSYTYINRAMAAIYEKLPGTFMYVGSGFLDATTDNAEHLDQSTDNNLFNIGAISPYNAVNSGWDDSFNGIRLANTFINNIDTVTLYTEQYDMSTREAHQRAVERYRGESRFLRGYFYFELFKRYGQIPIVDDWVSDVEPVDLSRQSIADVVAHINNCIDDAIPYLPTKAQLNTNSEYSSTLGHAILGAAYALKSRTYLYAASPLFSEEGSEQSEEYYNLCVENSLVLINDVTYSLVGSYADLFEANGSTAFSNSEVIFDRRSGTGYSLETNNQPVGFYGGLGKTNPTQDLVDAYEMTDGTTFDWDNATHAANPYADRDARFYATILYNGCSMLDRTVETFEDGFDATNSQRDGSRTGYYLKKFIDTTIDLTDPSGKRHYWPVFRLAEIYLNYAESMNELYGPYSDPEGNGLTALAALNKVRVRAGQPSLNAITANISQDYLREKIRNERRVEFAFEDHRHWDLRRWKAGSGTLNGAIHGVKIVRDVDSDNPISTEETTIDEESGESIVTVTLTPSYNYTYELFEVEQRVFDESYMYLYPIPSEETLWSQPMEQNPGW